MPTVPPERAPLAGSDPREPHQARQVAESFGADAERYDRARPSYPGALVERIVAASPGPDVLDAGCGTCLLYTSPSPRDGLLSRMPSSA